MDNNCAKIILAATHGCLTKVRDFLAIEGTINALKVSFQFTTSDWDDTTKTAVFIRGRATPSTINETPICIILDENNECGVPAEILAKEGVFSVGVFGVRDDYRIVSNWICYKIDNGCYADGSEPIDPSSTIYEQIISILNNKSDVRHNHDERYYTKDESNDRFLTEKDLQAFSVTSVNKKTGDVMLSANDVGAFANTVDEYGNQVQTVPYSAIKDTPEQIQPDWNQNDSTALDYVKNRPFYTGDPIETVLLEETTAEFEDNGNGFYVFNISDISFSLEVGQTYTVSWDGDVYICVCTELDGLPAIGNASIFNSTTDTGEPFVIRYNARDNTLTICALDSSSHTISIGTIISPITKIDEKYLPDDLPFLSKTDPIGTGSLSLNRRVDTGVAPYSAAIGRETTAIGYASHAEGDLTTASGYSSHSEGNSTIASGYAAHTEGGRTTASGDNSHAEGAFTSASGNYSHVEGYMTTAFGDYSHAEGNSTNVLPDTITSDTSDSDIITAWKTKRFLLAKGLNSHAEGQDSLAIGVSSHAEGTMALASGSHSHSEGISTTASAIGTHAEGCYTTASSEGAHAEGYFTLASSNYQHVEGKYNVEDTNGTYAHIVGNGSDSSARSNAHTLDWDGNVWFAGGVKVGGTSQDDSEAKELATKEYVDNMIGTYDASIMNLLGDD